VRYEIIFSPDAARDLGRLSARDRSTIRDMIVKHLRHEPEKVSRSRIKRLREFRHLLGLDVVEDPKVLDQQPVLKAVAYEWLEEEGEPDEPGEGS